MSLTPEMAKERAKVGAFPLVLAGMSYIPLVGVLFGVVAIVWGLCTKRSGGKKVALIGTGGICFTAILYGGLFYFGFVQRGGIYDDLRTKLAQNNLNSLVQSVEFYHITYGKYPDSLEELQKSMPKDSMVSVAMIDPRSLSLDGGGSLYFFYQKVDSSHYYLRGIAPDGKPFSPGALVPQVPKSANVGLLIEPPKDLDPTAQ